MSSAFLLLCLATVLLLTASGEAVYDEHQATMDTLMPSYVDAYGAPTASILVSFPEIRKVTLGMVYPVNLTQDIPTVRLEGTALTSGKFYSLITVDPDSPCPESRTISNILHYLVTNIPGSISPTEDVESVGDVVDAWIGPQPPCGTHRYMFLLFDQGYEKCDIPLYERELFSVRNFTSNFNLGFPIGGTLFRASANELLDQ